MDITKENFDGQLETIIENIKQSDFLAIDGEFTGLYASSAGYGTPFDTPEERYQKIAQECSDFLMIQFGLTTFKSNEEKRHYEAHPYNFFVFPTPRTRRGPDKRFLCQSTSMAFLHRHSFNFNKLFGEGIPYLTVKTEQAMRAELEHQHEKAQSSFLTKLSQRNAKWKNIVIPEEQKSFLDHICGQIAEYLSSQKTEALVVSSCTVIQRKLIYQTVKDRFPEAHIKTKTREDNTKYMEVTRAKCTEELLKPLMEKQKLKEIELDQKVGFTKIISAITKYGKLVVGHNMILDIFHIITNFHGVFPRNLQEFKAVTKTVFPRLMDTKLMANTTPFLNLFPATGLNDLFQTSKTPPFVEARVEVAQGFERYQGETGSLHEAGYDALITGQCFANMIKYLGTLQNPNMDFQLPSFTVAEWFVNKLFLAEIKDIPYVNINGPDLEVKREHFFHITCPKEWESAKLKSLLRRCGKVQVSWITDTTALVGLCNKENSSLAWEVFSQYPSELQVMPYAAYHLNKSRTHLSASSSASVSSPSIPAKRKLTVNTDDDDVPKKVRHSRYQFIAGDEHSNDSVQDEEDENQDTETCEKEEDEEAEMTDEFET